MLFRLSRKKFGGVKNIIYWLSLLDRIAYKGMLMMWSYSREILNIARLLVWQLQHQQNHGKLLNASVFPHRLLSH